MTEPGKSGFESGVAFLVRLTDLEIQKGILIIGHRFEPFRDPGTPPEGMIVEDPAGLRLPLRSLALSFSTAQKYFNLFGDIGIVERIVREDEANAKVLSLQENLKKGILRIRAYECGALIRENGLGTGDFFLVAAQDAGGRRFRLRACRQSEIGDETRSSWEEALKTAFAAVFADSLPSLDPFDAVRDAYLRAAPSALAQPGGSYSDFFNLAGCLDFVKWREISILWKSGTTEEEMGNLLAEALSDSADFPEDEFSEKAGELSLSVDSSDLEAFVLDALRKGLAGGAAINDALDRILVGATRVGVSGTALASLRRLGMDSGEEILQKVDMSDFAKALRANGMRSEALVVYERFLAWMRINRYMPSPHDASGTEAMTKCLIAMKDLVELIYRLNLDLFRESVSAAGFGAEHAAALENARQTLGTLVTEYNLPAETDFGRSFAETSVASQPRHIYELEMAIDGTKPPVRRILSVPGDRTLAALHGCIQDAFGWSDGHLHEFIVGGTIYGEPSDEDFKPPIPDDSVCLDDLRLRKGSRFEYVYDLGDDWRHSVRVSAKTRPEASGALPLCIEGARAAPPEDCGGLSGYQELLECIATPVAKRTEDQKEFIAWKGRWTPEKFNIAAVNKKLAKR
jgi:hypothetical protein